MYVCVCQGITDRQIRRAVDQGARTLQDVQQKLPVAACCGRCGPAARELIRHHAASREDLAEAELCPEAVFAG
jgi:bacterioferritin-associated ferredoxin